MCTLHVHVLVLILSLFPLPNSKTKLGAQDFDHWEPNAGPNAKGKM